MRTGISIQGLQIYGYHGLHDEERSLGQRFLFDVRCGLAEISGHLDDRLENSVGYDVLASDIAAASGARKFRTMEALAEAVARTLLDRHPVIEAVEVRVAKHSPPMALLVASAAVEITLARSEL